jgi:diguanylate cyclase (GGDEF)-like protein/PAS domain S-box-containing protein
MSNASALRSVKLGLPAVILLLTGVSACWMFSLRHVRRAARAEERKFATLLDAAPEAIIGVSDDGAIRFTNARVSELFGYTAVELDAARIELLIPQRLHAGHILARSKFVERPQTRPMGNGTTLLARRKDGAELPVEISLSRIEMHSENVALCIVRDVTEQTRAREALLKANRDLKVNVMEIGRRAEELRQLTSMGELLQCCSEEREVHAVMASAVARLFPEATGGLYLLDVAHNLVVLALGWKAESGQLKAAFAPQECWALRRGCAHRSGIGEAGVRCGHEVAAEECGSLCIPMVAQGETLGVLHSVLPAMTEEAFHARAQVLRVIAEHGAVAIANLRLRDALRLQSIRDPLTGLYNRRFLDEWLNRETNRCQRADCSLSVLMLDLDHFKHFNDAFGHQSGDTALRELSATLQRSVRSSDVVCRIGGEEIAVLLPDTSTADAALVAEKLRSEVEHTVIRRNGQVLRALTTSIGIASFPDHGRTAEELLQAADVALYAAKAAGRNQIICASHGLIDSGGEVLQLQA